MDAELETLLTKAKRIVDAMTPVELESMRHMQAAGWVRSELALDKTAEQCRTEILRLDRLIATEPEEHRSVLSEMHEWRDTLRRRLCALTAEPPHAE